jgi:hypothetical protein
MSIPSHYQAVWSCRGYLFPPPAVRYGDKRIQSGTGMLRYRTEKQEGGKQMPVAIGTTAIFTLKARGWGGEAMIPMNSCTAVYCSLFSLISTPVILLLPININNSMKIMPLLIFMHCRWGE